MKNYFSKKKNQFPPQKKKKCHFNETWCFSRYQKHLCVRLFVWQKLLIFISKLNLQAPSLSCSRTSNAGSFQGKNEYQLRLLKVIKLLGLCDEEKSCNLGMLLCKQKCFCVPLFVFYLKNLSPGSSGSFLFFRGEIFGFFERCLFKYL